MSSDEKTCQTCMKRTLDLEQRLAIKREEILRLKGKVMALQDIVMSYRVGREIQMCCEDQVKYLQKELRGCCRLRYKEQQEFEQFKVKVRALASYKSKFQGYELPEEGIEEVF